jgi:hypothetical protein
MLNKKYHDMSFSDIDIVRNKIILGRVGLIIKRQQKMLYLNQMLPKYRILLKRVQDFSIIALIAALVFLFINWKVALVLLLVFIAAGIFVSKKALTYIGKNCMEDRVFLKFALSVGLVEIKEEIKNDV